MSEFKSQIPELLSTDPRITVGRFTYGDPTFKVWADNDTISIGAFCSIAEEVTIFGGGEHNLDWVTTFPLRIALGDEMAYRDGHPATKGKTSIGNDVWIGYGATILSGVTVGDGAVIGAKSVVVKDVAPYTIVAGNPANAIRQRFSNEQVNELQRLAWWNWPMEKIVEFLPMLCNQDIDSFLRKAS